MLAVNVSVPATRGHQFLAMVSVVLAAVIAIVFAMLVVSVGVLAGCVICRSVMDYVFRAAVLVIVWSRVMLVVSVVVLAVGFVIRRSVMDYVFRAVVVVIARRSVKRVVNVVVFAMVLVVQRLVMGSVRLAAVIATVFVMHVVSVGVLAVCVICRSVTESVYRAAVLVIAL